MDPRDCYRDKFGEAGAIVPCTYFNNELVYFGRSQVVYRLGNEIATLAKALMERFRLGRTAAITGFDIATGRELILKSRCALIMKECTFRPPVVIWAKRPQWPLVEHYSHPFQSAPSASGGGQIVIAPRPAKRTRSIQLPIWLRRVIYGYATVHGFVHSIHGRSGNRIIGAASSSGYGRAVAAYFLTREHIGETTGVWYIQPNTFLQDATLKCKRSGGVQELYTPVCGKWRWTSSDFIHVPVAEEAVANDSGEVPVLVQAIAKVSKNADECKNFSRRFTSTVISIITGLNCPQPASYFNSYSFEENLVTFLETILHIDIDGVPTLHEVKAVRKSYFEENTNQLPTTVLVGTLVTASSDHRREIEPRCYDWGLKCTLHEVRAIRKSCFKDVNRSPWPTIIGRLVTVTAYNQSEVETSEVVETLLHSDDDLVLNLRREAKPVRKSYFREQSSLDPNYVGANQDSNAVVNGSTFKVSILRNRTISIDVIQMCVFDETMLLLLVKNQVLLRGGSLSFCARCLNRQAKTCRSHIISRCVQGQILGNNTCIWISQKEELVSSNNCWFRLLCQNCDNSTCVDENKYKKRFCAEELKVSPQKIPAVELRVIYAFFFRGIMTNIDLLLSIARNQEWWGILNCVLRLREQCIKPRSAIKVSSCKLPNDSALRNQSLEFPILVSSEKWGSFFYLQLRQYCYAIPIEQLQQDSLQANFPAIAKAISSKLGQKREKYLRNFSKPINQALMVTGYVTGGQLFI